MAKDVKEIPTEFTKGVLHTLNILDCIIAGYKIAIVSRNDPRYFFIESIRAEMDKQLEKDIK